MRLTAAVCRTDKKWPTKSWPTQKQNKTKNQVLCYDSHVAQKELNHGAPKTQFQIVGLPPTVCVTLGMFLNLCVP